MQLKCKVISFLKEGTFNKKLINYTKTAHREMTEKARRTSNR